MEPFITRERAEYGDTYSFDLDISGDCSLGLYTRMERKPFAAYPSDSLDLGIRWISPADSSFLDHVVLSLSEPADSTYSARDYIFSYIDSVKVSEYGRWRLRIQVRNNPESIRGLGIILTYR